MAISYGTYTIAEVQEITITSTSVTYQKSTSGTTTPTSTWLDTIPSVGEGEYLWTKTVVAYSDSSETVSYSVSRNAVNGTNGNDGNSPTVTSTVTQYVQSDSGTSTPTSGWNTTPPTAVAGKYIWTKVTVTYSDGATAVSYSVAKNGVDGKDGGKWYSGTTITGTSTTATIFSGSGITSAVIGDMYLNTTTYNTYRCTLGGNASTAKWVYVNNIKGDTGKGITSIQNLYCLSTSNIEPIGTWDNAPQTYIEGRYYWTKSHIIWNDNTSTDTTPVLDNALTSANANAIDARKVATNYLAVDPSGIMVANMEDGEQTPSGILTGKNVFIDNDSVDIRNGQTVLSSFGNNLITLGQRGKSRLELSSSSISGISEIGVKNFNIINGDSDEERTITKSGTFSNSSSENGVFIGSFTVSDEFYYFHNITVTIIFNYIWDGQQKTTSPLTLIIDDPVEDETPVVWYINETEYSSSYNVDKEIDCYVQHDGGTTILSFNANAELKPKTTSASYEMGNTATYSVVIETKVYQNSSYTFGSRVVNSEHGANSFAIGEGLIASFDNQIAVGKYNDDNPLKNYAFMIGNGVYGESRSNAFAVDWNGNTEMGDIYGYGLQLSENSQSEMNDYIKCIDVNDDIIFNVSKTGVVDATGRINAPNIKLQKDSTNNADYLQCQDDNNNVNFRVLNDGSITTDGDAEIGESLVVNGSAYSIPNVTINKKSTNTTDYIKCQDANQTAKFRVLNDGGVIIGNDLVVNNNQTTNGYLNVVGDLRVDNRAPIAVKTFSWDTGTVRANGGWSKLGESVKVDGYYALGTLGFGCFSPSSGGQNVDWFVVTRCFVWSGANPTMDLTVWNQHTSATGRCVVWVKVLYAAIGAYQWLT